MAKWKRGKLHKNRVMGPRYLPDATYMADKIRTYAKRAVSHEPSVSTRLVDKWEKNLLANGHSLDAYKIESQEGLQELAIKFKDQHPLQIVSKRLFKRLEDGSLQPYTEEFDKVPPRVRVFQLWQSWKRQGFTEYNCITVEDTKYLKVYMFFSGMTFFFEKEDLLHGFQDTSIIYHGRDQAMLCFKRKIVDYPISNRRKIPTIE